MLVKHELVLGRRKVLFHHLLLEPAHDELKNELEVLLLSLQGLLLKSLGYLFLYFGPFEITQVLDFKFGLFIDNPSEDRELRETEFFEGKLRDDFIIEETDHQQTKFGQLSDGGFVLLEALSL